MFFRMTLLAGLLLASPALAFVTSNGFSVRGVGPVTFEVAARGSRTGPTDFWCAAGEYAWRRLHASTGARIYRLSEPPRRGGETIIFSLSPEGKASRTGLAMLGRDDGSLSVASALNQCEVGRQLRNRP
jgi:hypothetical protein